MNYLMQRTTLKSRMFEGRGFLAFAKDDKERHGIVGALSNGSEMYLSLDAVIGLQEWIRMWEHHVANTVTTKCPENIISIGSLSFIMHDDTDMWRWGADPNGMRESIIDNIARAKENFTFDFHQVTWKEENSIFSQRHTESLNHPGRQLVIRSEPFSIEYTIRFMHKHRNEHPTATKDLSMVKMAESLFSIANTATYPETGYELDLKLGFGNIELAKLSRDQLREIAERLVP